MFLGWFSGSWSLMVVQGHPVPSVHANLDQSVAGGRCSGTSSALLNTT